MGLIKKLNKWANAHTYLLLDLVRVLLGVVFFVKGIEFMNNYQEMERLASPFQEWPGGMIFLHYLIQNKMEDTLFLVATAMMTMKKPLILLKSLSCITFND